MEQKTHILITKFAETCIKNGLYGVSRRKINLISNIIINDHVFIYDITNKEIHGPFSVKKDLFKDDTFVWEYEKPDKKQKRKTKEPKDIQKDKYPYRIQFDIDKDCFTADSSILWELYWNKNDNLLPISTSNKSVITILPDDSKLLLEKIRHQGINLKYDKPHLKNPNLNPFDFFKNRTS